MPPGTGDVALSLSQTVPVVGSIVVTTPQKVSLADSLRAVRMYQKLNIPPIGLVENMSYYACTELPSRGGHLRSRRRRDAGRRSWSVPFLGRLPMYQPIREGSDSGVPIVVSEPGSSAGAGVPDASPSARRRRCRSLAHKAAEANKGKIPLIPVR